MNEIDRAIIRFEEEPTTENLEHLERLIRNAPKIPRKRNRIDSDIGR